MPGAQAESKREVVVGVVTRPQGIHGEVRVRLHNAESELCAAGRSFTLRAPGLERRVRVARVRAANGALVVAFEGVEDRDQAEKLRGAELSVPRAELPALEDGEFYACDIEGAVAQLVSGETIGKVVALESYPTCNVLVVEEDGGARREFPLTDDVVAEVDVAARRVLLKTREGL